MKVMVSTSPFGSTARTRALMALHVLESSHPRELARFLDLSLSGVQKALISLERDALVVARTVGRSRVYRLNPRAPARDELERYLSRLVELDDALLANAARLRRRPRRTGKPL